MKNLEKKKLNFQFLFYKKVKYHQYLKEFPKFKASKKREVGTFRQREVRGRVISALILP